MSLRATSHTAQGRATISADLAKEAGLIGAHKRIVRRVLLALLTLIGFVWSTQAEAALTFELRSGNATTNNQTITIDSNQCSTAGPRAAYVGGKITNTGGSAVTGITAAITSGTNANFFLTGGQPASQSIGTLAAGASVNVFWLIGVSCVDGATTTLNAQFTSSLGTQNSSINLTIRTAISANAGGSLSSGTLGPGAVVGQTIYFDATYDFGGSGIGDEFILQPTGSQSFDASCFRLTGTEVTASNITPWTVGLTDWLYRLQTAKQTGNGYYVTMRYYFQYLCAATSTVARPYAQQTSGTQLKYTGNYDGSGSIQLTFPGATNPFTIAKTVSQSSAFVGTSGNLTYTITITNPSSYASKVSSITDVLPSGMTYAGLHASSDVTAANSSSVPSNGATGTLTFSGQLDQSYSIAAGGTVVLKYYATRPSGAGTFTNNAQGHFGSATTSVAQSTYTQLNVTPLSITKVSSMVSDPVHGSSGPYPIPGAVVNYVIAVGNPNPAAIDGNSVIVTDNVPPNAKMCVTDINGPSSGPVTFVNGSPSSSLTYSFTALGDTGDSLEFSSDSGANWDYSPTADAQGCDATITNFRVLPVGSFAASSSFSLYTHFRIK